MDFFIIFLISVYIYTMIRIGRRMSKFEKKLKYLEQYGFQDEHEEF